MCVGFPSSQFSKAYFLSLSLLDAFPLSCFIGAGGTVQMAAWDTRPLNTTMMMMPLGDVKEAAKSPEHRAELQGCGFALFPVGTHDLG